MSVKKKNPIRTNVGFSHLSDADFQSRCGAVGKGTFGNPAYSNPPVDPAVFKATLESYSAAIVDVAAGGGKKAVTEKHKQRVALTKMMRKLGHYVEANCKDDLVTLTSSGFEASATGPVAPQPLARPTIKKVDHGNAGEFVVKIKPVPKARIYELRHSAQTTGTPVIWTIVLVPSAKGSVRVNGLTPGTTYALQVRAAGLLGYTDWSDAVTRMCT
jgi:hypothetical protein